MIRRRAFLGALGLLAAPLVAEAQSAAKVARIGVFQPGTQDGAPQLFEAFRQGMRERGYVEGQHVVYERRFGENRRERIAEAAAELVRLKVAVIVTATDQGIAAVKQQTQTIPIVMANSTDPVGTGFVASLARPGGNITGNSAMSPELASKRLALLKEILPGLTRIAILWNPEVRGAVFDYRETEGAARALRMTLQSIEVTRVEDLERALAATTTGRAEALIVPSPNPVAFGNRGRIASFALQHRLPTMFSVKDFAEAGGLLTYGPSPIELWRRAAAYVDKILKGARPGDLPVEQPTKFELVINLKTAKALGLTTPPSLLQRADQVIQ